MFSFDIFMVLFWIGDDIVGVICIFEVGMVFWLCCCSVWLRSFCCVCCAIVWFLCTVKFSCCVFVFVVDGCGNDVLSTTILLSF